MGLRGLRVPRPERMVAEKDYCIAIVIVIVTVRIKRGNSIAAVARSLP